MPCFKNVSLKKYSTLKIGPQVKYFWLINDLEELKKALKFSQKKKLKVVILGNGSNILFPEKKLNALVLKINFKKMKILKNKILIVGAGVLISELIKFLEKRGFSGFEWAIGIPATIGGCLFENCTAFKKTISDSLLWIKTMPLQAPFKTKIYPKKKLHFSYKASPFKKELKEIIIEAGFKIRKKSPKSIKKRLLDYLQKRLETQPLEKPSLGCVFKNPYFKSLPKKWQRIFKKFKKNGFISAGLLIEKANLKGKRIGDIEISQKHGNFFINLKKGTSKDFKKLIRLVKKEIKRKFQIKLEEEIEII